MIKRSMVDPARRVVWCAMVAFFAVSTAGRPITDSDWMRMNTGEFPGVLGSVTAIANYSGFIYIGGDFRCAGDVETSNIARWDGTSWAPLGSGVRTAGTNLVTVKALACDSTGNLYAAGLIDTAGEVLVQGIAKWDGTTWHSLNAGGIAVGTIECLACDLAGNLFAGGRFDTIGGIRAYNIAKYDGVSWQELGTGINRASVVLTIACKGINSIFVGGTFDTAGNAPISLVAEWSGNTWRSLGKGFRGSNIGTNYYYVTSLAIGKNGHLFVGGDFDSVGSIGALNIAEWDGNDWKALGRGVWGGFSWGNTVRALACDVNGDVFAGGQFFSAGDVISASHIARWNGRFWYTLQSGIDSAGFVNALSIDDKGNLIMGGSFNTAGGTAAYNIARWNGTTCSAFGTGIDGPVTSLAIAGKRRVFVGGGFRTVGGQKSRVIAEWNDGAWHALDTVLSGTVRSLAYAGNGTLYAGGNSLWSYKSLTMTSRSFFARWDGRAWSDLGTYSEYSDVFTIAYKDSLHIFSGGHFSSNYPIKQIGMWNGKQWDSLGTGLSARSYGTAKFVYASVINENGLLYIAGVFDSAGHNSARNIAQWDGSAWQGLGAGLSGPAYALACDKKGNLFAGGDFDSAGGKRVYRIAKWDGSAWDSLSCGMNGRVKALACDDSGGLYAGGNFDTVSGMMIKHIAQWDGVAWAALGSGTDEEVSALATDGSILYVGGSFTTAGSMKTPSVAAVDISGGANPARTGKWSPKNAPVKFRVAGTSIVFDNIAPDDRISLYSLTGRRLREINGVSRLKLFNNALQPLIIRIHRNGKILSSGLVLLR